MAVRAAEYPQFRATYGQERYPPQESAITPNNASNARDTLYRPGDAIKGRWQIRQIHGGEGRSGMGIVYVVDDILSSATLAVKTLQPQLAGNTQLHGALRSEAELWYALGSHPNVVTLRFVEQIGEQVYLFMDYIAPDESGRNTLTHFLTESPLSDEQVGRWGIEICRALTHMYRSGISAHRDIKPDNVMIDHLHRARLTDLGLAKAYLSLSALPSVSSQHLTVADGIAGTPGYLAPELIQGDRANVGSDIYAFGLVLAQMITGKPWAPFTGVWAGDLAGYEQENLRIRERIHADLPTGPWQNVLARCLAYDPGERPTSFEAIEQEMLDVCRELGVVPQVQSHTAEPQAAADRSDIDQINALYNLGRLGEALDHALRARKAKPLHPGLLTCEGVLRSDLGDTANAIPLLEQAVEIAPGVAAYWNNLGKALRSAQRAEDALHAFTRGIECDPRYSNLWASKGNCLADLDRVEEARVAYEQALEIDQRDTAALWGLASVCARSGALTEAMSAAERLLSIEPNNDAGLTLTAELQSALQESARHPPADSDTIEEPSHSNRSSTAMSIDDAIAASNQCYAQRQFDAGLALVQEARRRHGETAVLRNNEGVFLTELGHYELAIDVLERAQQLGPERVDVRTNLGRAYRRQHRIHDAIACHEQAIALGPAAPTPRLNHLVCLYDLDRYEAALPRMRDALQNVGNADAKTILRPFDTDLYYTAQGQNAYAQEQYELSHRCAASVNAHSRWSAEAQTLLARSQFQIAVNAGREDVQNGSITKARDVLELLAQARDGFRNTEEADAATQQIDIFCTAYHDTLQASIRTPDNGAEAAMLYASIMQFSTNVALKEQVRSSLDQTLFEYAVEDHTMLDQLELVPRQTLVPSYTQAQLDTDTESV